ncbi:MAG: histidine biosynthesis family protein [Candidatus Endolissoclinum sp. TMED37]|nr:MAG: histidine biosynthesis family protein [Candidatus Endolissoclinum sp. TMED37]
MIQSFSTSRLIPIVLLKSGLVVRSQNFTTHQVIGNPLSTIKRLSEWDVDEIVILDISDGDLYDIRREDLQQNFSTQNILDIIKLISEVCFVPLAFGGGVKSITNVEDFLRNGADKVVINSAGFENKNLFSEAAKKFGSQSIVASVDLKKIKNKYYIFSNNGEKKENTNLIDWLKCLEDLGVGEILINSINRDGAGKGFDNQLIKKISNVSNIPIIFCGGAGEDQHFVETLSQFNDISLAAANIFHFKELSYPNIKKKLLANKLNVRPCNLNSKFISRDPIYKKNEGKNKIKNLFNQKKSYNNKLDYSEVRWCSCCLNPSISAAPLEFNSDLVCTACQMSKTKYNIRKEEWNKRLERLKKEVGSKKNDNKYDCVVGVSGGKDSYFQVHVLKNILKFNPLLVTYNGNNYSKIGWNNLMRMKDVFDCDHLIISPSVPILKKLNKICFYIMGDMNWHAHVGIMTQPMSVAVKYNIPFVFYGEHGYADLSGQFTMNDFPEVTYRDRLEHFARGYEWNYFLGIDGLKEKDFEIWKYPSDEQIMKLDLRGLFLGNYVPWEANVHTKLVINKYGFQISDKEFDRTYRKMSNLDDIHENGVHDYLKFIKFGYGRATDHASKDIRAGIMSRENGIKMVKKYDHVKPSDLSRWLKYVDMSEEEFDKVCDTFRDPRVWYKGQGVWRKKEIK